MERGSMEKLKYDIRLAKRRGFLRDSDRDAYLSSLPDVESKRNVGEEGPQESKASDAAPTPREPAGQPAAPAPPPASFGIPKPSDES